jgi:ABC-type siderophore export system fused ATPase/permease subunit
MWLLRFLMLLALVVWIGGIIFFAFVEAPTLFTVLPTTRLAGDVVSVSLTKLHWIGLTSGIAFLICSLVYNQLKYARPKALVASHVLVVLMLVLTAIFQFRVTPKMRDLRAEMQAVDKLPGDNSRLEFDRLHAWSTRLEGGALFLGLGVVLLTARRFGNSN